MTDPLETAVANALSAATEGGSYTEAPDPSDEPGSPYVRLVAASLRAGGVVVAGDSLDAAWAAAEVGGWEVVALVRRRSWPVEARWTAHAV
jgi:hypothetical protein